MRKTLFLLTIIFILGFLLRLYRFNNPIADWHSWRQADTSAVSRNFVLYGIDVLHPTYDDISNIQTGKDNPKGYRFVEFPLYNLFQAGFYQAFGIITLEEWGRLITIISSLIGSLFLFLLIKRRGYAAAAWLTLIFSVFLPYNIYYGRVILPDPSMIATMLAGLYFLDKWLDSFRKKKSASVGQYFYLFLAIIFTASSFLLKGYTLFYGLTYLALVFSVFGFTLFKKWELWAFAIISVAPFALWRKYMLAFPEGIPANSWLFNGNGIRFRPAFFRWIFYERLTKLIGGYINGILIPLGVIGLWVQKKDRLFFLSFPLSALIYLCVIATGNVQHDYYQIVIMPAVSLLMGFGVLWAVVFLERFVHKNIAIVVVCLLMLCGLWLSWLQVRDYFNINNWSIVIAGAAVDKLTPKNAKIIAPYDGDTSFLYQTKRKGWPAFEKSLPEMAKMGADYLVLANTKPSDFDIGKEYKIISVTKDYILFDLHKSP